MSGMNDDSPETRRGRDTDPSELKHSLPPNTITFADILGTHQAILGEMVGLRSDMTELCRNFNEFKRQVLEKPSWVNEFLNTAHGVASRLENAEEKIAKIQGICRFRHGNGQAEAALEEETG
jgi:DNA repair ATPase RecN